MIDTEINKPFQSLTFPYTFLFCRLENVFSLHFIKYIFRIKSAIGESSTIIFDWYVSPDEIYTNTELYSYVSPFGGQKKIQAVLLMSQLNT